MSNTTGTKGSEIKRGVSATGNESKDDVKKAKKAIGRSIKKAGKEIKDELD